MANKLLLSLVLSTGMAICGNEVSAKETLPNDSLKNTNNSVQPVTLVDMGYAQILRPKNAGPKVLSQFYSVIVAQSKSTGKKDTLVLVDPQVFAMSNDPEILKKNNLGDVKMALGVKTNAGDSTVKAYEARFKWQENDYCMTQGGSAGDSFRPVIATSYQAMRYDRKIHGELTLNLAALRAEKHARLVQKQPVIALNTD